MNLNYAARIRVPSEIAGLLLAIGAPLLAVGIVYGIGDSILKGIFLRKLRPEEQEKHISMKMLMRVSLLLFIMGIILFTLPAFGIELLGNPFQL